MQARRLMQPRALLRRAALEVAPLLLGAVIAHTTADGTVAVRITEVEAYGGVGEDPGSHAHRGERPRNRTMFGPPGHLYAYFTYGMHTCANIVCAPEGAASAVLLRAGEVVAGLDLARSRRPTAKRDVDLARGPARLALALDLTLRQDGADLLASPYALALPPAPVAPVAPVVPVGPVVAGPRVGVSGEGGDGVRYPWRSWIAGDPTVSAYRRAVLRPPRGTPTSRR